MQKLAIPVGHMGRVAEYIANKAILSLAGAGAWQSLAKLGKNKDQKVRCNIEILKAKEHKKQNTLLWRILETKHCQNPDSTSTPHTNQPLQILNVKSNILADFTEL